MGLGLELKGWGLPINLKILPWILALVRKERVRKIIPFFILDSYFPGRI